MAQLTTQEEIIVFNLIIASPPGLYRIESSLAVKGRSMTVPSGTFPSYKNPLLGNVIENVLEGRGTEEDLGTAFSIDIHSPFLRVRVIT
jgi:hypothetical protein